MASGIRRTLLQLNTMTLLCNMHQLCYCIDPFAIGIPMVITCMHAHTQHCKDVTCMFFWFYECDCSFTYKSLKNYPHPHPPTHSPSHAQILFLAVLYNYADVHSCTHNKMLVTVCMGLFGVGGWGVSNGINHALLHSNCTPMQIYNFLLW